MKIKGYYAVDTTGPETYFNVDTQVRTVEDCDDLIEALKLFRRIISMAMESKSS